MEFKDDIGSVVKTKLESYTDSPDDSVWDNIETELKRKKRRRGLIFWFSGIALGALLIVLWATYPFGKSVYNEIDSKSKNPITNNPINTYTSETDDSTTGNSVSIDSDSINAIINSKKQEFNEAVVTLNKSNTAINEQANKQSLNDDSKINNEDSDQQEGLERYNHTEENKINSNENPNGLENETKDNIAKEEKVLKDSLNQQVKKNKILLQEKEKDSIEMDESSRWSVTPQVIWSNYGALNATASDNSSINYGVLASYRMFKTTYVRIGVRRLSLQQTIEDSTNKLDYLEFPLEIKHAPFNKKFNPYFTGGFSYYVLQDAEADNLNATDYEATMSINLGLGLETKIFNKFYINIEPNFNYQLKPFTETNEIKPYIFSVQTGIEYRF